jgi:SPP1 family predicted phage head-tail adaptor
MQAGKLDRRIAVERATTAKNDFGEEVPTWAPLSTVWAQVLPISDQERWRASEVSATVSTRFRIRWGLGVTAEDRIVYEGRVYEISGVKELGRREGQEVTAAARAD